MYCIKINLCVSLTQVGKGVNIEISRGSQAIEGGPSGVYPLPHSTPGRFCSSQKPVGRGPSRKRLTCF